MVSNDANGIRLRKNIVPLNYHLLIKPDMSKDVFYGTAEIEIVSQRSANTIELNALELEIESVKVLCGSKEQQPEFALNKRLQKLVIKLKKSVSGKVLIKIEYKGINNDKMYGFYRSTYTNNGKEYKLLTTQFEPTSARAMFPCFDEPSFKATFDVEVLIDKKLEAISNMPVKSEKIEGGLKRVTFERTPKMSTYLLYLGVGDFERTTSHLGKLKVSVVTVPGRKSMTAIPLEYGKRFIKFYEEYFGIKFPLPKMDFIAIPDFAAGAMENWGAITFREIDLLADKDTSLANRQNIAITVSHELAHQWFGDLVTMAWWDDLWLNESFATFMSYKASNAEYPEFKLDIQYFQDVINSGLVADELVNTHPINVKVENPDQINGIFDNISYEKGGSILYMLENYVGAKAFRNGLHAYLKKHAYSNAVKSDLWNAIQAASGNRKIAGMMADWITKPGHPIVEVRMDGDDAMVRQRRFTINSEMSDTWRIPINYASEKGKGSYMLEESTGSIRNVGRWVKVNYGQAGLYRVDYGDSLLNELGRLVECGELGELDAFGLENDLFVLARSGRIKLSRYLSFIDTYYKNFPGKSSEHYLSLSSISSHLGWLFSMGYDYSISREIKEASEKFHVQLLGDVGFEKRQGEPATSTLLRSYTLSSLGMLSYRPVVDWAMMQFDKITKGHAVDSNVRSAVYATVAWNSGIGVMQKFIEMYKRERVPDEQIRLLSALARFRGAKAALKVLAFSKSKFVKLQDSFRLPVLLLGNPETKSAALEWCFANWQKLMRDYPSSANKLGRFVSSMSSFSDARTMRRIAAFFSKPRNNREDIKREVKKTIERLNANIRFVKMNSE